MANACLCPSSCACITKKRGVSVTWKAYRWVWRLEAPLHVGMPPAGALNRCRLYVPARMIWAAFTAEISRSKSNRGFPNYDTTGKEIASNCRFTNLYPAEKKGDDFLVWLPEFKKSIGLQWRRSCNKKKLSNRDFKHYLLISRPSTAVTPESDSAAEGTLRETECINPWWRLHDKTENARPVLLYGYVFIKEDKDKKEQENLQAIFTELKNLKTLFIGGDTRYGLGKITLCDTWRSISNNRVFGKQFQQEKTGLIIKSDIVWGHVSIENDDHSKDMLGMIECLGTWDYGKLKIERELYWVPGSSLKEGSADWVIGEKGYWSLSSSKAQQANQDFSNENQKPKVSEPYHDGRVTNS